MEDTNDVHLIGTLTRDVEVKTSAKGTTWVNFGVVCVDTRTQYKDTLFVLAFGAEAEAVRDARAGDRVEVWASLRRKKRSGEHEVKDTWETQVIARTVLLEKGENDEIPF